MIMGRLSTIQMAKKYNSCIKIALFMFCVPWLPGGGFARFGVDGSISGQEDDNQDNPGGKNWFYINSPLPPPA